MINAVFCNNPKFNLADGRLNAKDKNTQIRGSDIQGNNPQTR